MAKDIWEELCNGRIAETIQLMRDRYAAAPKPGSSISLISALLWDKQFASAWEVANDVIDRNPLLNAKIYEFSGTSLWCMDRQGEAVTSWRTGLECAYADGAGGASLPLLLFFASVRTPELIGSAEARSLLEARARDRRVRSWPGAYVRFLLDEIDEEQLRLTHARESPPSAILCRLMVDFYVAVKGLCHGDAEKYGQMMRQAAESSLRDFNTCRDVCARKAEYSIAQYEAARPIKD